MASGGLSNKPEPIAAHEVEQAILGILLFDSEVLHGLPGDLGPQHFHEPFHQRLFARIRAAVNAGRVLDVAMAASAFASDPAFADLGGAGYLADLFDQAPAQSNATTYAAQLIETYQRRELQRLGKDLGRDVRDQELTTAEILEAAEQAVSALRMAGGDQRSVSSAEASARVFAQMDAPDGADGMVLTGLEPLDKHLGGMGPGEMIVLGGRTGMGKSAIAGAICENVALSGLGVLEIGLEMSIEQMARRHLTSIAHREYGDRAPGYSDIRRRRIEYDQRTALEGARAIFDRIPLELHSEGRMTIPRIRALILRKRAEWKKAGVQLGMVCIDHMGLVLSGMRTRGRYEDQTEVAGLTKQLAKDLEVPILALVQLGRQVEQRDDKRPQISDLKDSGSWENDADMVWLAYREAYYALQEKEPDESGGVKGRMSWADWNERRRSPFIDLFLPKIREGRPGAVRLWASMKTNSIRGEAPDTGGLFNGED